MTRNLKMASQSGKEDNGDKSRSIEQFWREEILSEKVRRTRGDRGGHRTT